MAATRIFLMGVIILFFGVQLRAVDTFVLNEKVSAIINKRVQAKAAKVENTQQASLYDAYWGFEQEPKPAPAPKYRRITPPRWLGWSFLSIGAVLVCTSPAFRMN